MRCLVCEKENDPGVQRCQACGHLLPPPTEERKLATVIFADLVDHTTIESRFSEEWVQFLYTYWAVMEQSILRYGGTVEKYIGDAVFAVFGMPQVHEDDAERAVRAAVEMVGRSLDYLNEKFASRFNTPLRLRVGIATDDVMVPMVPERGRLIMGPVTSFVERLQKFALPNTVIVSEKTYGFIAPLVEADRLKGLDLKGFDGPHEALILRRFLPGIKKPRGVSVYVPLVNREDEMTQLARAGDRLLKGQGQIVMLTGEAGLGKSRLIGELLTYLGPRARVVEGRCHEFTQSTAYSVVAQHLRSFFQLTESDSPEIARNRMEERMQRVPDISGLEVRAVINHLLGLDIAREFEQRTRSLEPEEVRAQVIRAVAEFWRAAATALPLVLMIEDLHWMDSASAGVLHALMPIMEQVPVMLLCAFRPERASLAREFRIMAEHDYPHRSVEIRLTRLSEQDTEDLAGQLLEELTLPPDRKREVARRSEGNPLYVEEMVRTLQAQDATAKNLAELPATLKGILQARLTTLSEATRRVLQTASVIGRAFPLQLLQAMAGAETVLDQHLYLLQRDGFLVEQERWPHPQFAFHHVLLHEAAYGMLMLAERRDLHRRLAEIMTKESATAANLSVIFNHFVEGEVWERSVEYGERAAAWAREVGAPDQSLAHYEQTVAILEAHADTAPIEANPRIRESYGDLLVLIGRFEEARLQYERLKAMAQTASQGAHAERKLAAAYRQEGKLDRAVEHLHAALLALPPGADPFEEAWAHLDLGYVEDLTGSDAASVLAHCERARLLAAGGNSALNARVFRLFAIAYGHLGEMDAALDSATRALEFASQSGDQFEVAVAHNNLADIYRHKGEIGRALEHVRAGLTAAERSGRTEALYHSALLHTTMGELYLDRGQWGEARRELEQGLRYLEKVGPVPRLRVELLADLAQALVGEGMSADALSLLDEAQRLCLTYSLHRLTAKLWRIRAEAYLQTGDLARAEDACGAGMKESQRFGADVERPALLRICASVAARRGDTDASLRFLADAAAILDPRGLSPEVGRVYLEWGRTYLLCGNREQARSVLHKAKDCFLRLGIDALVAQVTDMLSQAGAA